MRCNLCQKVVYKFIFDLPFCQKHYVITRDFFQSPVKAGLPKKITVDKIIEYCEQIKKKKLTIHDLMDRFDIAFSTAKDYLMELEGIGYIEHLDNGEWEIKNE